MKLARYSVPSSLELLLGIDHVRSADIDVYRDTNVRPSDSAPYRARVGGKTLRTRMGAVRKFRTMAAAIKAAEETS